MLLYSVIKNNVNNLICLKISTSKRGEHVQRFSLKDFSLILNAFFPLCTQYIFLSSIILLLTCEKIISPMNCKFKIHLVRFTSYEILIFMLCNEANIQYIFRCSRNEVKLPVTTQSICLFKKYAGWHSGICECSEIGRTVQKLVGMK